MSRHQKSIASMHALSLTALLLIAAPGFAQVSGVAPETKPVLYAAPPDGFDPTVASSAQLEEYGLPPRPDINEPKLLERWTKMVTTPTTRLTNVKLETTNIINGVIKDRKDTAVLENTTSITSSNWSGFADVAPAGTFKANYSYVSGEWVIPAAGVENCSSGAAYDASEWVGLDGFTNNDVLQAGTQMSECGTSFAAWYEWYTAGCTINSISYPCNQTNVSLPVNPGDTVAVEVWYTTSAPQGHAWMVNYSTGSSLSVGFFQPPGPISSYYAGDSVEWVVERPSFVGGGIADLANYVSAPMPYVYAGGNGGGFYPSSAPSGSTIYNITMTCPSWTPSSACSSTTDISAAYLQGPYALWFNDEGPASVY